ncbi:dTDP-4-dehydrorhamnose reductase [Erwinia tracheiphila]|uniref:dTDP-4-dehydrorhamnose reductase n=1 Tax=Erwinia tracheiphila TaxID=65700 RepID=A0A0M2K6R7_9GAMM|nr:dTDP-4-dehydrorhamnose reductase [Erwinia tracheiphila]AXF76369.1 dTDP-4-dehydrorhamnose reductase [Erwinia tracheiphila]EOS96419.1 dTDP-4-dehydrorhamnose reductase [Erwinia tracheiphila PSU-1]KKF35105.1 dTDP-4-dehydrorhamnose reductase [Erwinia tracheiphila]UIA84973.1 dTDP-4-dehydrorhamnose reductase [Erwinia tracheiphila]UIA86766.1 dTDP-4-dehydrorhamnose reductase [Erwinia tracheiphila]
MKILLLGKNGQVGWELQRALAPLGTLTALDRHSSDFCGDLANPTGIAATIHALKPDVIVNAAAHTAVDKAESEPALAATLNTAAVAVMADAAEKVGALLIHYSTDYVFNGEGETPWSEDDATAPLSVYGKTKREGEEAIVNTCSHYLIFRTSWVYAAKGNNFAKTMLKLAADRDELSVINDQFGAPTGAELIADCTAHALRKAKNNPYFSGIYHLIANGTTTWYEYASYVISVGREKGLALKVRKINAVTTDAFPTAARRPANSRLNITKFQQRFGLILPDWRVGVERMLSEIIG